MNFLHKDLTEAEGFGELRYKNKKDRKLAMAALTRLQKGYCAYSEIYLKPVLCPELEHFDPRKKNTPRDGLKNWHAVIRWVNAHKPLRIDLYEPLPDLEVWKPDRVRYEQGLFVCDDADLETKNLIEFLGVNRPEIFKERSNHIARIRNIQQRFGNETLMEILSESPADLSFPSAIVADLGIPAFELIDRLCQAES